MKALKQVSAQVARKEYEGVTHEIFGAAAVRRRSTKEWKLMTTLAGFRIMSEGLDNSRLAPDAKGCISEEHVAEWFADARDQGYAFKEIEEDAALMTAQDGQSRRIWVEAAHNGTRVSITRWLTA